MDMDIINKLLNNGVREIALDVVQEQGDPDKIKAYYEAMGWIITLEEGSFWFAKKDARILLKG